VRGVLRLPMGWHLIEKGAPIRARGDRGVVNEILKNGVSRKKKPSRDAGKWEAYEDKRRFGGWKLRGLWKCAKVQTETEGKLGGLIPSGTALARAAARARGWNNQEQTAIIVVTKKRETGRVNIASSFT